MKTWLVDTGPLVTYLDATDPAHPTVARHWDTFTGRLATTSAVITEAMQFAAASRLGPRHLADLVAESGTQVYDLTRPPEVQLAAALMEKYADTPMDFADATLVLVAEALDVQDVLTLDRRGFRTYRTRAGRAFRIVPDAA